MDLIAKRHTQTLLCLDVTICIFCECEKTFEIVENKKRKMETNTRNINTTKQNKFFFQIDLNWK